uniref:PDZ domain-containing protein n=1 Tax=Eptatretus burgeri TaxID=7764 RepID=A0A8C4QWY2_EPTBU
MHRDVERTEDQEYEEVELYRMFSQEKLGLTVCYRTDDEEDLGIYITEIDPSSIAAQDGRIREGDRIMQINGVEIQDREKAVALLTKEDNHHVSLLLAHAEMQLDEGWIDEDHNDFLEDLCVDMIEKQHDQSLQSTTPLLDTNKQPEEDTVTSSSNQLEKDSGLGRTDESTRLEESSDGGEEGRGVMQWQRDQDNSCNHEPSTPVNIEATVNTAVEECRHFQTLLEMKCRGPANGDAFPWFSSTKSDVLKRVESDQDLSLLREELRSLRLECRSFVGRRNGWAFRPSGEWPDTPTVTPSKSERSDKDTSSAYNTAESCRSSPRSPHLLPLDTCSRVLPLSLPGQPGQAASLDSVQMIEDGEMIAEDTKKECVESVAKPRTTLAAWRSPYPHTHIPVHARHYRSYMQLVQQRSAVEYAQSTNSLLTAAGNERTLPVAANGMEMRSEWKVKIRSDGSRYITKRPVRDRLLRERAMKIQEERSGMTTDDDALSELKMGRYWPKEQRKQHLSHAREQRRRREFMQRSRLECLRENPHEGSAGGGGSSSGGASEGGGVSGDGGSGGNRSGQQREVNIIELSHRKMMKKRSKKILDNWMTIQELLAHGSRSPDGTRIYNSLLSVTTV